MAITTGNIIMGPGDLKLGVPGAHEALLRNVGSTQGGISIASDRTYYDVMVDQAPGPVDVKETVRQVTLKTNLAESSLVNLARVWGYPETAVASGVFKLGVPATTPFMQLVALSPGAGGLRRKLTGVKVVSVGNGEHRYQKSGETIIPVEFRCLFDPAKPQDEAFGTIVEYAADATPPAITGSTPADAAEGVATDAVVTLTFSEHIELSALEAAFSLTPTAGGAAVAGSWAYDVGTKKATFTPTAALGAATGYTAAVTTRLVDLEGNKLETAWSIAFTTA